MFRLPRLAVFQVELRPRVDKPGAARHFDRGDPPQSQIGEKREHRRVVRARERPSAHGVLAMKHRGTQHVYGPMGQIDRFGEHCGPHTDDPGGHVYFRLLAATWEERRGQRRVLAQRHFRRSSEVCSRGREVIDPSVEDWLPHSAAYAPAQSLESGKRTHFPSSNLTCFGSASFWAVSMKLMSSLALEAS